MCEGYSATLALLIIKVNENRKMLIRRAEALSYSRAISQKNATAVRVTNVKSALDDADSPAQKASLIRSRQSG